MNARLDHALTAGFPLSFDLAFGRDDEEGLARFCLDHIRFDHSFDRCIGTASTLTLV